MAESNFTTPEQKNAADRSSGSASEKLEPSLTTLQGETAQTQDEPTIPVREEAPAAPKGFGAVLRAAREAEGISVGDMAVQCRLAVTQIRALEEEHLENLPEPVYVRAFIRGYAHALKIDPAPLVDDYMMRCGRRGAAVEVGQLPNRSEKPHFEGRALRGVGGACRGRHLGGLYGPVCQSAHLERSAEGGVRRQRG